MFLVSAGAPIWPSSSQFLPVTPAEAALTQAVGSSVVGFGNTDCIDPPTLGIRANLNAAYSLHEFSVYDPMTPLAYYILWKDAGGQASSQFLTVNIFCPAVTTAALARRYGVGFVLEPANSRGPTGAVFEEDDRERAALPDSRRSRRDIESVRTGRSRAGLMHRPLRCK